MGKVCGYAQGLAALRCISSSEAKNKLLQPPKKVLALIFPPLVSIANPVRVLPEI